MDITYREASPEDLPECVHLFMASVEDMRKRHNIASPPPKNAAARLASYQHILSTGIFHVAVQGGRIVALACAIVRDRIWFLAGFWVKPGLQQKHIGMPLLRRVWEAGKKAGATTYFVWSSVDLPAVASYLKLGMLPGTQILVFEGAPTVRLPAPTTYTTQALNKAVAMGLDKVMRGTRREMDHDYFKRVGWRGIQVLRGGIGVGYFYRHDGIIGPAAWTHPRHADAVLSLACRAQKNVVMMIPGSNHDAIQFALASQLRLSTVAHLFMTSPFGALDRYLPSGPALF